MSDSTYTEMHITFEWINYADVSLLLHVASVGGWSTPVFSPTFAFQGPYYAATQLFALHNQHLHLRAQFG